MRRTSNYTLLGFAVAAAALLLCSGCDYFGNLTLVDGYRAESPVSIALDWSGTGLSEEDRPSSVTLVMGREVDTLRRVLDCGPDGLPVEDAAVLPNGDWLCVAFNGKAAGVSFTGLEELPGGGVRAVKAVSASLDTLTRAERLALYGAVDPNPAMPFFKPLDGLFCAFTRAHVDGMREDNGIVMEMRDAAVPVEFRINVDIEAGVEVENILGAVSGVPGAVSLMSREVSASRTGKAVFAMEPAAGRSWSGTAIVPGILSPASEDVIVGDGILCVKLRVKVEGKSMIYVASINLKPVLDLNPVLMATDVSDVYRYAEEGPCILEIPAPLWLTPEGVKPGADGPGLADWVEQAKIDGEER